jgi:hypothetical protein
MLGSIISADFAIITIETDFQKENICYSRRFRRESTNWTSSLKINIRWRGNNENISQNFDIVC